MQEPLTGPHGPKHTVPLTWVVGESGPSKPSGFFHTCSNDAFVAYHDVGQLVRYLADTGRPDAAAAAEAVESAFAQLVQGGHPNDLSSEAILYSIIRRISRESIGSAILIDQLADRMVALCRLSPRIQAAGTLVFHRAHALDRPSLRVLSRFLTLLDVPGIHLYWYFPEGVPSLTAAAGDDLWARRIGEARGRLFGSLLSRLSPAVEGLNQTAPVFTANTAVLDGNGLLEEAAACLVSQNYERAYLACASAMAAGPVSADHYRVLALVDANLARFDDAYEGLQKAIALTEAGPDRAHLHYLAGLLCTKRYYDFERARAHFEEGRRYVAGGTERDRLEEGWLYNGLSFVDALECVDQPEEEKTRRIVSVLEREIQAFNLVRFDKGPGPRYLRFNLLTNIAFLLEIQRQYKEAIRFWDRAFGKFTGYGTDTGAEFEKAYRYRVGVLTYRTGSLASSIEHLTMAVAVAGKRGDRLSGERIWYALGYVQLAAGQMEAAARSFRQGLALTLGMRNWIHAAQQAVGLIHALIQGGAAHWTQEFWQQEFQWDLWHQWTTEARQAPDAWLRAHPLEPVKPKLPSYIPEIDLEETPPVDINRYLVSQDARPIRTFRRSMAVSGGRA